jgi:hypothetical protein
MFRWLNKMLDKVSEYLAARKGLLPSVGMILIIINFVLQFFPNNWLKETNLLLHLGLIIAILGLMLAWAL